MSNPAFTCFNAFPNKPWLLRVCITIVLKTQWEKKILLMTSNFSFSHSVFYPFEELSAIVIKLKIIICKLFQFNVFPNKPWLLRVCITIVLKTQWEKKILLITSNFSFSHSVFYPYEELSAIVIKLKIIVCKLFQFGRV